MADIVNLRNFKKRKARDDKAGEAEANRAKFGATGKQKKLSKLEAELARRKLDGAKLSKDED
ncbi:DUF4169 family protein [Ponticaulis sp.]|uniref:DUF4169 family protein n=1 Tax=Ponticaulis sp. TaxID=2020902 RepID=UPI000B662B47|nr:DUF4169 family protein [Ponticaulis sp.]MAI91397.1 hypothetical protein [Ponticaulis sp.]OUX97759.1 MAG: hypothetical protein CBB65_13220 [Hyphomonadaceae bacterium TMED5]|tara:strand:+ start:4144 stop:4329 length:186 start_codon:yes stop_codon:yes gene_type:complete